ncbi:hypothetical protein JRO89_XS14G0088500 [Xanthoceras sorbifolium]|uniref:DUF7804 domain-containing protein n=1 Tax=Xanthoceras sorbifolium TaxID=99658 RepID=A0ABQ8H4L5_9ROSI|nr:hypothetical protein JRO89_XS14G0088500 [Xanthoceras sorbifolium]
MASVAVRCGGGGVTCSMRQGWRNHRAPSKRNASLTMMIGGGTKEMMTPISISISSASSSSMASRTNQLGTRRKKQRQEEAVSHENVIDEWMKDSVVEIVKNLREAPLLVQVYSDDGGNGTATRLRTEKAEPEDWLTMKTEWENGRRRSRKA